MPDIVFSGHLAAQTASNFGTALAAPTADRLVGDGNPALEKHFLDIAQAQSKAIIEPNRPGDDLESVAVAAYKSLGSRSWSRCYRNFLTAPSKVTAPFVPNRSSRSAAKIHNHRLNAMTAWIAVAFQIA